MSKFNLEKAMAGAPVVTRGGHKAVIVNGVSARRDFGDILVVVFENGKPELLEVWDNGKRFVDPKEDSIYDLFMAGIKKEGWINVYKKSAGDIFKTKQDAMTNDTGQIDTVKIEWEE